MQEVRWKIRRFLPRVGLDSNIVSHRPSLAVFVMNEPYASAVGTTVLQLAEIAPHVDSARTTRAATLLVDCVSSFAVKRATS